MTDGTAVSGASAAVREKPDAHHFESVSIRRFRGLEHIELEDLGAVNLLVGANGSGKTSVLEAIFLLSGLSNAKLVLGVQNQRNHIVREFDDLSAIFHDLDIDRPIELSAMAPADAAQRDLSIAAPFAETIGGVLEQNGEGGTSEETRIPRVASSSPDRRRVLLYEAKMAGHAIETPLSFTCHLAVLGDGQVNLSAPIPPAEMDNIAGRMTVPARMFRPSSNHDSEVISRVVVDKKKEKLIEIMRKIDPQIQDVSTSGDIAYLDTGLKKMLPITMFGGGVTRVADIISRCVLENPNIVLIDEMENGVHYKGIHEFLKVMLGLSSSDGIQIFMTVHSLDVLRALRDVLKKDEFFGLRSEISCFVLARDRRGKVRSYRYDYEQLDHNVGLDIEIR